MSWLSQAVHALANKIDPAAPHVPVPQSMPVPPPPPLVFTAWPHTEWPHDDNDSLIKFYGQPGDYLVQFTPPFKMVDAWEKHPINSFPVHRKCLNAFNEVFNEVWTQCNKNQTAIEHYNLHLFGGSYNRRLVRGSTSHWSVHAFGAAIDINPDGAPMGVDKRPTEENLPQFLVNAFKRQGATWGGDFQHRRDWMHFQFVREG